jgi:hypothetical protein
MDRSSIGSTRPPYAVGVGLGIVLLVLVCILTIVWVPRQHMLREKHYDEWDTPLDVPDMFMQPSFPPFAAPTLVNRHLDVVSDIVHLLRQHWMQNVVYLFQIQPDVDRRHVNATLVAGPLRRAVASEALRSPDASALRSGHYTVATVRFTFECLEPGRSNWTAVTVLETSDWPAPPRPTIQQPEWPPLHVAIPYCLSDPQWMPTPTA